MKRDPEQYDSDGETLPGDSPATGTDLSPEVVALTDHSNSAPVSLERDTVRDGVFVSLGRSFDSAPPVKVHELRENETENNRTLQYARPLDLSELIAADIGADASGASEWNKRELPLAPKKQAEDLARTKRDIAADPSTKTEPFIRLKSSPKKE